MVSNRKKLYIIALALLVVLVTAFIFSNSFYDQEESLEISDRVTNVIVGNKENDNNDADLVVRKLAHLVEFMALGIAVMFLTMFIKEWKGKSYYGYALFYVLAVAVADEHIQSFSDRLSSTEDIILDFIGAIIGLILGVLIIKVFQALLKHRIKSVK